MQRWDQDSSTLASALSCHCQDGLGSRLGCGPLDREQQPLHLSKKPVHPLHLLVVTVMTCHR